MKCINCISTVGDFTQILPIYGLIGYGCCCSIFILPLVVLCPIFLIMTIFLIYRGYEFLFRQNRQNRQNTNNIPGIDFLNIYNPNPNSNSGNFSYNKNQVNISGVSKNNKKQVTSDSTSATFGFENIYNSKLGNFSYNKKKVTVANKH